MIFAQLQLIRYCAGRLDCRVDICESNLQLCLLLGAEVRRLGLRMVSRGVIRVHLLEFIWKSINGIIILSVSIIAIVYMRR